MCFRAGLRSRNRVICRLSSGGFRGGLYFDTVDRPHERERHSVDQSDVEGRNHHPGDYGMECARAEVVNETHGLVPKQLAHFSNIEMDRLGAEEFFSETNTEINHWNVRGPADLIDQLRDRLVQLQRERSEEAEHSRGAENRENSKGTADRQGERELLRRDPLG
jgi:hypothetical protein